MKRFVAEDPGELVWLRLNRLKSVKLCESILMRKNQALEEGRRLPADLIQKKALGLSSAMEGAIGYWNVTTDNLNAKILSRYYAMLQMTIAEQVGSLDNDDDLSRIQRHTEYGHGLGSIRDQSSNNFPFNTYVFVMQSGHFNSYLRHLGIELILKVSKWKRGPKDLNKKHLCRQTYVK